MIHIKHIVCLLLVIVFYLQAKGAQPDSIIIRNFESGNYKAPSFNYTGLEDELGIMLFANESGVLQYDGSEWKIIPINNFSAVITLKKINGKIYVGGRDEFGYLERDKTGEYYYVSLRHLLELKKGKLFTDIWQIIPFEGDIYFQTYEMILHFDGKKVSTIPIEKAFIFKVGNELFASAINKGLAKIEGDTFTIVNKDFAFKKDMAFMHLKGLKGETLIFTADHGVYEFDTVTYKTSSWKGEANDFLAKNSFYHAVIWRDSLYACATYLAGLVLLDKEGKIVETYNKDNGLISNALRELYIDKRNNLWSTSDYGLNYLQVLKTTSKVKEDLKTVVRYITVNDTNVYLNGKKFLLETSPDYSGSIVFHFATPGFHKEELEYSYYLEGFESKWSSWKSDIKKEYTNLNGGEYVFHVKSRYIEGVESTPASAFISIPTPWFKTKTAYFLFVMCLGVLILGGVQYRTKRLRMLNKRLANIVSNRTQELVEQREQLRAANNELRIKNIELDNFVYRSSHDLVAPLKSMKGLINISLLEKNPENQTKYLNLMLTSVNKLEDFIKSIMEYSSNSKQELLQIEVDLHEILDSIIEDLKFYDKADKIEIIKHISPEARFYSDPKRLKIILSNLITNSIKYHNYNQEHLFIEVKSEAADGFVKVHIIDNGKGIKPEFIDKIFNMFFRATDNASGSGLGLYIVKDTVNKLGGEILVSSDYGKGTVFTLLFPCSNVVSSHSTVTEA